MANRDRKGGQRAVFLDRDGTLIEEVNFLSKVEDLKFFPFTDSSVKRLKAAGFLVIVVTNQSGVARGLFEEAAVGAIHDSIQDKLTDKIDAFFHCPHLPDAGCGCRKPGTGMIEAACEAFDIDLGRSWMVGDKELDVLTGVNAGLGTILVRTGYGSAHATSMSRRPDHFAEDLSDAVDIILGG
jgi:D-glycero-D-manno-heptose 1,7-bisphosphate phosphatase